MSAPLKSWQTEPAADSPPFDPIEGLVTTYFQLQGYITSSNKWFWVWEEGKQQRGYQDMDVLAVKSRETVIVSATGNLDDKVRRTSSGDINQGMVDRLVSYFDRCTHYLRSVPDYEWLVAPDRSVRRVVVYKSGQGLAKTIDEHLGQHGIELLDVHVLMEAVQNAVHTQKNIRTNNQILKLLQIIPARPQPV